ncbi:MAG: transglycosylase SLT domain-containing protein [Clostridia bacterium]|nr:transglycosylase SLT domain-containing protein [Clostridia bacterium]
MSVNTVYNISLCCILVIFFFMSWFLGSMLYAREDTLPPVTEESETGFSIGANNMQKRPEALETVFEPRETEVCSYTDSAYYYDIPLDDEKQAYVFDICKEYDVPCELVFAVMGAESTYTEDRISDNGDYGIMQINQINHQKLIEELGVSDFLDYKQNVLCGIYMLSDYYHRYTDFNKIAMCYRYGENAAKEMWEKGIYSTDYTRQIVRTIATLTYR